MSDSCLPAGEIYDAPSNCGACWGAAASELGVSSLMTAGEVAGVAELASMYSADRVAGASEPDGLTLLRFLRARKMDKAAALKQLQSERLWRRNNRIDLLLMKRDPCEAVYTTVTPHANHGFSKTGMPVYYERTGEVLSSFLL
jgi:hypothetical protein